MPAPNKQPEWVDLFLAALGACGNVSRSAVLAGVDVTGTYNRRNRYPEFRAAWERVLTEREMRAAGAAGASSLTSPGLALPSLACGESSPPALAGGELISFAGDGAKRSRRAKRQWSTEVEEKFLEELTASANVARAAAAVGFSATAIYKRKLRDRHFADGWEAAIAVGRSRLEAHLLVQADRTFDPEALPVAEGAPKVTVSEAISILKHKPAGSGTSGSGDFLTWKEEADLKTPDEMAEVRERILDKLERFREQEREEKLAGGWTLHGEDWIPPGWVRAEAQP